MSSFVDPLCTHTYIYRPDSGATTGQIWAKNRESGEKNEQTDRLIQRVMSSDQQRGRPTFFPFTAVSRVITGRCKILEGNWLRFHIFYHWICNLLFESPISFNPLVAFPISCISLFVIAFLPKLNLRFSFVNLLILRRSEWKYFRSLFNLDTFFYIAQSGILQDIVSRSPLSFQGWPWSLFNKGAW